MADANTFLTIETEGEDGDDAHLMLTVYEESPASLEVYVCEEVDGVAETAFINLDRNQVEELVRHLHAWLANQGAYR